MGLGNHAKKHAGRSTGVVDRGIQFFIVSTPPPVKLVVVEILGVSHLIS